MRDRVSTAAIVASRSSPRSESFHSGEGRVGLERVERLPRLLAQRLRELLGERLCLVECPGRVQPRVDHHALALAVEERPAREPVDELLGVRGVQHGLERVALAEPSRSHGAGEQPQVVVAEHHRGAVPEPLGPAQHVERARPAVDEVAHQPGAVVGAEADALEQAAERLEAALDVADRVRDALLLLRDGSHAPEIIAHEVARARPPGPVTRYSGQRASGSKFRIGAAGAVGTCGRR